MKISEIITDKYKLRIPPTVYYDLLADVQEAEEESCEDFKQKAGIVIEQLRADRDRLATALEEIRVEIADLQLIGYATIDGKREIASKAVLQIIDKHRKEQE